LAWGAQPKARTLDELALHVAMVPGGVAQLVASPSPAQVPTFTDPTPATARELVPALDQAIATAKKTLGGMNDAALMETFRLMRGDRELFAIPRAGMLRSIMLIDSSLAISLLALPSAIRRSVAISRGVSCTRVTPSASFAAAAGARYVLPARTSRMQPMRSSAEMSLSTYAFAPAFNAREISSSVS